MCVRSLGICGKKEISQNEFGIDARALKLF